MWVRDHHGDTPIRRGDVIVGPDWNGDCDTVNAMSWGDDEIRMLGVKAAGLEDIYLTLDHMRTKYGADLILWRNAPGWAVYADDHIVLVAGDIVGNIRAFPPFDLSAIKHVPISNERGWFAVCESIGHPLGYVRTNKDISDLVIWRYGGPIRYADENTILREGDIITRASYGCDVSMIGNQSGSDFIAGFQYGWLLPSHYTGETLSQVRILLGISTAVVWRPQGRPIPKGRPRSIGNLKYAEPLPLP